MSIFDFFFFFKFIGYRFKLISTNAGFDGFFLYLFFIYTGYINESDECFLIACLNGMYFNYLQG